MEWIAARSTRESCVASAIHLRVLRWAQVATSIRIEQRPAVYFVLCLILSIISYSMARKPFSFKVRAQYRKEHSAAEPQPKKATADGRRWIKRRMAERCRAEKCLPSSSFCPHFSASQIGVYLRGFFSTANSRINAAPRWRRVGIDSLQDLQHRATFRPFVGFAVDELN